jgi:hypothetical protein
MLGPRVGEAILQGVIDIVIHICCVVYWQMLALNIAPCMLSCVITASCTAEVSRTRGKRVAPGHRPDYVEHIHRRQEYKTRHYDPNEIDGQDHHYAYYPVKHPRQGNVPDDTHIFAR